MRFVIVKQHVRVGISNELGTPLLEFRWNCGDAQSMKSLKPVVAISEVQFDSLRSNVRSEAKSISNFIGLLLQNSTQGGVQLVQCATRGRREYRLQDKRPSTTIRTGILLYRCDDFVCIGPITWDKGKA
jgi:hypothetical protein